MGASSFQSVPVLDIESVSPKVPMTSVVKIITDEEGNSFEFERTVFYPEQEGTHDIPEEIHYTIASKEFYQNINRTGSDALPRKVTDRHWDSVKSIVYIRNEKISQDFENQRARFLEEAKVNEHGRVPERFLFHGSSMQNINIIVEENFAVDVLPKDREKSMLFGLGVYLSPLPGVSMMYGDGLLLCKVLLGKSEEYHPTGVPPPPIPAEYDSRVVIRDKIPVVIVVKRPEQILPYCIVNLDRTLFTQAGNVSGQKS